MFEYDILIYLKNLNLILLKYQSHISRLNFFYHVINIKYLLVSLMINFN